MAATIRLAAPDDYDAIAAVVDDWWGRPVLTALPRLFLDHFYRTSLIAEGPDGLAGFLIGFLSPSQPDRAYIHFAGVSPAARGQGLARRLYDEFFALAGTRTVGAITAPLNSASIAFHRALGFTVTGPVPDYQGPGRDYVLFERQL